MSMDNIIHTTVNGTTPVSIKMLGYIEPTFPGLKSNTIDCEIEYLDTGRIEKASCQVFPNLFLADEYITTLRDTKSKYLATPIFALEGVDHLGLAFVKRLASMKEFFYRHGMWTTITHNAVGKEVDFNEEFLGVLEEILQGLKDLHDKGYRHGNLIEGIHLSEDETVMLSNFAPPSGIFVNGLSGSEIGADLVSVRTFCKLAKLVYEPHKKPFKLDLFYKFFDFENYDWLVVSETKLDDLKVIAKFIYALPLMWKPAPIALLIDLLSGLGLTPQNHQVPQNPQVTQNPQVPQVPQQTPRCLSKKQRQRKRRRLQAAQIATAAQTAQIGTVAQTAQIGTAAQTAQIGTAATAGTVAAGIHAMSILAAMKIESHYKVDWPKRMFSQKLKDIYWHRGKKAKSTIRLKKLKVKNIKYKSKDAILHFGRNAIHHHSNKEYCVEEGVKLVLNEFPDLSLVCYFELLHTPRLISNVPVCGVYVKFHDYVARTLMLNKKG